MSGPIAFNAADRRLMKGEVWNILPDGTHRLVGTVEYLGVNNVTFSNVNVSSWGEGCTAFNENTFPADMAQSEGVRVR